MNKSSPYVGIVMVLAAAVLWGTTGTAQSLGPAGLSAYWVGALRLLMASVFFLAFSFWQHRRHGEAGTLAADLRRMPWRWVLLAGAAIAAYNLSFFAGVKATGVAVGTAIAIGSGPIWAGLLQIVVSRKPPRLDWWLGTLLAVAGGCLMVTSGGGQLRFTLSGVALCLAAGLSYASYALVNKRLVTGMSAATVTLCTFGTAALIALPLAAAIAGPFATVAAGWAMVAYLGVVTTGVAYLLFSSALQRISGATGVALALAEPVTAFALAVLVVGEQPALGAFAGLGLVLAGLAVVIWTEIRTPPA